jgi:hypothetical protein
VAEQGSHKPRVGGSSPPAATIYRRALEGSPDLSAQVDPYVPVVASPGEDLEGVWQLVVDLEGVAIRVLKVDAFLADVIDGSDDLDATRPERGEGLFQRLLALRATATAALARRGVL